MIMQNRPRRFKVESLLSARLFIAPKIDGERLVFESDLSGRISLYAMRRGGSVPMPLIPGDIALQQPHHIGGEPFYIFPKLGKILLMIDQDGDENYQPFFIPLEGGIPEPVFGDRFVGQQVFVANCDAERNMATFTVDPRRSPEYETFIADLASRELTSLGISQYGNFPGAVNEDFTKVILSDSYLPGDNVLYLWEAGQGERRLLHGKPLESREPHEQVPLLSAGAGEFVQEGQGLLFTTGLYEDTYGLGYLALDNPAEVRQVEIVGTVHDGVGELTDLHRTEGDCFFITYNIDGVSWAYEGRFDVASLRFTVEHVLVGQGELANGVLDSLSYDEATGHYALSLSTATSPSQIYTIEGAEKRVVRHTDERILGIPDDYLSPGEDASFVSHDGLRVSARLYLPSPDLGFEGPRPVIYYIHGGPQSQERPDFTWFSMPLIQYFTLNGFAVFVPNVRGSSGYGLSYMKQVDRDWGGQDRLDHVEAVRQLREDPRLDMDRAGVMGRSYGGYMTLTLVGRHPELWKAASDMFGPYSLFTFVDRLPETWKTYFYQALGDPEKDHDFYVERSPSSYLHNLACPMLVIQGANDPRVIEQESRDVVEQLREKGKDVEYMLFDNEGHDVLKFENKVRCYGGLVEFFARHLKP
jgi:pimeloyl-ACP methyl ester carboxylesterase